MGDDRAGGGASDLLAGYPISSAEREITAMLGGMQGTDVNSLVELGRTLPAGKWHEVTRIRDAAV